MLVIYGAGVIDMSKIRSALEVALERSADVKVDRKAVSEEKFVRRGKTSAGRFLSDGDDDAVGREIKTLSGEERGWFKKGLSANLLANIILPRSEEDLERLDLIGRGLKRMAKDAGAARNLEYLMNRYGEVFRQYLDTIRNLESQLRAQWDGRLRQKEEQLRQQIGQTVSLTVEQDPEFRKVLSEKLAELDSQYSEILDRGKAELRKLL
ncbi:hypothetical protein S1OALGB6SA_362 [Olavius algarvensis spirochete endosymbiont]|nr:hypothetical protein S1OALGB6SA_362 [Olavius algarvensis spirochete endosymbiont]